MSCVLVGCFLLATVAIIPVQSQFPNACVNIDSLKNRECCPVPNGFTEPCGTDGERGDCKDITVRQWSATYDHYNMKHQLDDRYDWPRGVFKRSCKCRSNYAGHDCSKCKYGYHGNECKQKKVLTRKNFAKMSSEEQHTFMRYMNMSRYVQSDYSVSTAFYQDINETIHNGDDPRRSFRNVSIHELFVWLHYYTTDRKTVLPDKTVLPRMDFGHAAQGFPTWHRLYLLSWERALQEMVGDEDYTIPFWDWTENSDKCEICTEELLGNTSANGDVVGKYFDDWNTICYAPGRNVTANDTKLCDPNVKTGKLKRAYGKPKSPNGVIVTFPTKKEVEFALRFETYDLPPFGLGSSCSF
ncbi:hypothetical protein OS493_020272 [Desmophyllum pertusum]|uniref:Tyrosinase n=1 Tax=Desmophyllum pertusum TaxID=174260 RepID=A0A9W9ZN23_9CNID|nr:hypothetical protein OS493_020272 [Desmophyllum pertusum]